MRGITSQELSDHDRSTIMAIVNIPEQNQRLDEPEKILEFLSQFGIWYRYSEAANELPTNPSDEEILACFAKPIDELKAAGGYVTADVINITPELPNLDTMLAKFNKEHWHDEDEVRFIVDGSGIFHINPSNGPVFSVEMFAGDMINVPRGMYHWFDLCESRTIKAIRLFQDQSGWTPHYTDSQTEQRFEPLCFGPRYL